MRKKLLRHYQDDEYSQLELLAIELIENYEETKHMSKIIKLNIQEHAIEKSNYGSAEEFATSENPHCKDGREACIDCLMRGSCLLKEARDE